MNREKNYNIDAEAVGDPYAELRLYRRRLETVVELAADFYWETDPDHHLTYYWSRDAGDSTQRHDPLKLLGKNQRELGEIPSGDEAEWDRHLAERKARKPFSGFLHKYLHPEGGMRYVSLSGKPVYDAYGEFTGYCGVARDVTEEVENERLLQLESQVLRHISTKESVIEAVRGAMEMICKDQNWEAGSLWELDDGAGILRYKAGWASENNDIVARIMREAHEVTFARGEGLPGWVWDKGEMLWVPDLCNDERLATTAVTELTGWNAAFLFPVMLEGELLGVLDFYAPAIDQPSDRLLHIVRLLGTEIGHYYQRARALDQLRESEARFRSLTELSSDWYWEQDSDLRFTRFEGRNKELVAALREEFIGKRSWELDVQGADSENSALYTLKENMENHRSFYDVILLRRLSDGSNHYFSTSGEPVFDEAGRFAGYRGVSRDVSNIVQAEEHIRHLATHDHLTGLPNRALFSQLLNHSIETTRRYGSGFAVLFLDLDGFKAVNDNLGHNAGDRLLVEVAMRLKQCIRDSDIVARLGGDEFVILAQGAREGINVERVADNILAVVSEPFLIQSRDCRISASIGICICPEHGKDEDTILNNADSAMYLAKQEGKNNYRFYHQE